MVKDIGLFGSHKKAKPTAAVFVDYEHWYISLHRMYQIRPNLQAWMADMKENYDILDVTFFADFSNQHLANEVPRIREITNNIIFTAPTGTGAHKKDFTDFIMLDHIYQRAMSSKEIDTFIIFSGDGHFSSVANYLKSKLGKEVGIYAVRGGMSTQLKNTASWTTLLPEATDPRITVYRSILTSLRNLSENRQKRSYPSFKGTVTAVSRYNRLSSREVTSALRELINKECITQHMLTVDGKSIKTLKVDWQKCKVLGYWE